MQIRLLGRQDYLSTLAAMRAFSLARDASTPDELWLVEHAPIYTQGLAGRAEHLLNPGALPVVQTDRGGQITFHGPGQVLAYPLLDLRRLGICVKEYVYRLEHAVLKVLEDFAITGHRVPGAPGIYVRLDDPAGHARLPSAATQAERFFGLGKVAALGVKVSHHCTYHGLALNVAMDLAPFAGINPCGYAGLRSVDLATLGVHTDWTDAATRLGQRLAAQFEP